MGEFLYYLTIKPIWLLFEIIFRISYRLFTNPGISILSVSLVMNILVLPMYLRSDAMQEAERKKQKEMEYWVGRIRKTFRGDERFMMLSEYYRQNDYKPWYVLKSSLSLMLQVPFFIAAYDFLSNLSLIQGASFLMIEDLGRPDGLIHIANYSLNLLPILMTAINLTSAAIYTKNGTKKEKIQTVVFALVFLVLLYGSPSGLVFYWTLNNVFSLCKNLVMSVSASVVKSDERVREKNSEDSAAAKKNKRFGNDKDSLRLWGLSAALLAIFTGLSIPVSLIADSPMDFANNMIYHDPVRYALLAFAIGTGVFVLWGGVVFFLSGERLRRIISFVTMCCSVIFIADHMFFSGHFGFISYTLVFDEVPGYSFSEKVLNLLFIFIIVLVLIAFYRSRQKYVYNMLVILIVCEAVFGIYNIVSIEKTVRSSHIFAKEGQEGVIPADINNKILKLSSKGKNVVIIMLDRSIGAYIPFIFNEKPELEKKFAGFTFYPNTVSFGTRTENASAALFGGYEYTAYESDKREDVLLKDKQNEALKLLPILFSNEGYHSTLCDMPYINLKMDSIADKYIFDNIKNCDTYGTMNGEYNEYLTDKERECIEGERQKRNFFFYSLFRSAPLFAQVTLYDDGNYLSIASIAVKSRFITSMSFLRLMPELTEIKDESSGELIIMDNDAPHENTLLNPPDYEPDVSVRLVKTGVPHTLPDGSVMDMSDTVKESHYDSDMAAFLKLGDWLEYLREKGVYDNTRIIITSDHGYRLEQFSDMIFDDLDVDVEHFNPVLLVKDYDADFEGVRTDDTFMTNADVPAMAMEGIIKDPVNPFTGNPVNNNRKYEGPVEILALGDDIDPENDKVYDREGALWYTVGDNIFKRENWERIK